MDAVRRKTWWRRILLLVGITLIGVGVVAGYFWFYRLAPTRRLWNADWRRSHSPAATWAEEQKYYRRTDAPPEVCNRGDAIGYYGDKAWTIWVIEHLRKKDFFLSGCRQTALACMTNQRLGGDENAWITWFDQHEGESQDQWIQQGFAQYGVKVHLPPTAEDASVLLPLLGNIDRDSNGDSVISQSLKYNAFRWLRDSGFDWRKYVAAHPDWRSTEKSALGVCFYAKLEGEFPADKGMGRLAFAGSSRQCAFEIHPPFIATRTAKTIAYALVFGGIVLGVAVVVISLCMKRRDTWAMRGRLGNAETTSCDPITDDAEE
jgi:hypothetical protein